MQRLGFVYSTGVAVVWFIGLQCEVYLPRSAQVLFQWQTNTQLKVAKLPHYTASNLCKLLNG